uniref:ribosomal protein L16 n=1 Tax=Phytophthora cinnamomi TaxID=4785 RepID=UPI002027875C|nr:ribosomal protein L16 [Phytophthora cinnamomi]DAZ88732.1 TPA_asm: ribosomal protein L16 [Phytophthora cinnamomi var. cinnamomi]UXG55800.1 ribosomal protein L16 [Phytophthora cinnamomi]WRY73335.1 ribosomal protein L16 [Phytophthora cinnamomi]WRY73375.1 ribosomal protein L16 [Phytophthora cinnamomi]WRY73415.1 ribosomal protein L16 [Phytophthora cinnamomi]
MLFPKKTKYKKQFKGKLVGKTTKGNNIIYGKYALKVLKETRLTSRQIEATRRIIIRKMKRLGFLWIRVFPDIPVTAKPTENRMGKGKGAVSFWVAKVRKGQILYEISGISLENAKKVLKSGSNKLPVKTKFIYK